MQDPYADFAAYWRTDHERPADPKRVAFFKDLVDRNSVRTVLDCACGTGNDLLLFRSLGCAVWGSDISPAMLGEARKVIAEAGVEIPLRLADFRNLPQEYETRFDLVVCLTNSITHLLEEAETTRALRSMHGALREGGILVMDQGQTDWSMREKPRFSLLRNDRDVSEIMVMDYLGDVLQVTVLSVKHGDGGGGLEAFPFKFRILLEDDYRRLLAEAGFESVDCLGSFSGERYDQRTSKRLVVVAKKQGA